MNISVVIPAYNEEKMIAETVRDVKKYCQNVVVVDDGSSDVTGSEAQAAGADVLRHLVNRGQGAALRTGINYALQQGADIIVTYDADGQFEAAEIEKICQPILNGECNIVLGSRFLTRNEVPFFKVLFLKLSAVFFTQAITGKWLTDIQNGFRAMNRKAAEKIIIRQDRMGHAFEIIHEIARLGLKYKEIPVTVNYTDYSMKKGQKISGALKILFDLIMK